MDKDFYNLDLNQRLVSLKNSNISEVNKQLILDFVENCFVEGLGTTTHFKVYFNSKNDCDSN